MEQEDLFLVYHLGTHYLGTDIQKTAAAAVFGGAAERSQTLSPIPHVILVTCHAI